MHTRQTKWEFPVAYFALIKYFGYSQIHLKRSSGPLRGGKFPLEVQEKWKGFLVEVKFYELTLLPQEAEMKEYKEKGSK